MFSNFNFKILRVLLFLSIGNVSAQNEINWLLKAKDKVDEIIIIPKYKDYYKVRIGENFGLIDSKGIMILPPEFEGEFDISHENWIRAKKNGKVLMYNTKGKLLSSENYSNISPLNSNYAIVWQNKKVGLVDNEGKVLIPIIYQTYKPGSNDLLFENGSDYFRISLEIANQNALPYTIMDDQPLIDHKIVTISSSRKKGILDKSGKMVVPIEYYFYDIDSSGLIVASLDRKTYGIINTKNETLLPFTASNIGKWIKNQFVIIKKQGYYSLFSFPGNIEIIPHGIYTNLERLTKEKDWFIATKNKMTGILDMNLEEIIPFEFKWISNSTRCVKLEDYEGNLFYFDIEANYRSKKSYDYISNLNDSILVVKDGDLSQLIHSPTEKIILSFDTLNIASQHDFFIVHDKGSVYSNRYRKYLHGLYDRNGNAVVPIDSITIQVLPDNSYVIKPDPKSTKTTIKHVASNGTLIRELSTVEFDFDPVKKWFIWNQNSSGKTKTYLFDYKDLPGEEEYFIKLKNSCSIHYNKAMRLDKKIGLFDNKGNQLLPFIFEEIGDQVENIAPCKYNDQWGIVRFN
jgi:hypothetical protein